MLGPQPSPRTTRHLPRLVVALAVAGCASLPARYPPQARGPGAIFATIDAAALDALHFAYGRGGRGRSHFEWGGTIRQIRGGYTYDGLVRGSGHEVRLRLGAEDVAWFHTHMRTASSLVDRLNERPSPGDRHMVDRVDPRHRPLYILTPSARVVVYWEGALAEVSGEDAFVARAPAASGRRSVPREEPGL